MGRFAGHASVASESTGRGVAAPTPTAAKQGGGLMGREGALAPIASGLIRRESTPPRRDLMHGSHGGSTPTAAVLREAAFRSKPEIMEQGAGVGKFLRGSHVIMITMRLIKSMLSYFTQ